MGNLPMITNGNRLIQATITDLLHNGSLNTLSREGHFISPFAALPGNNESSWQRIIHSSIESNLLWVYRHSAPLEECLGELARELWRGILDKNTIELNLIVLRDALYRTMSSLFLDKTSFTFIIRRVVVNYIRQSVSQDDK